MKHSRTCPVTTKLRPVKVKGWVLVYKGSPTRDFDGNVRVYRTKRAANEDAISHMEFPRKLEATV